LALAAGAALSAASCGGPPAGPDILLVTIDTLRADHVGAYGYERARTPEIDALAARGVRFETAIAPMPRTTPALASMMSGRSPAEHGSREVGQALSPDVPLLAEILATRGYETLAVSASQVAGPKQGLARGFESFLRAEELTNRSAKVVSDEGIALAGRARKERPLLLWAHYFDPHFPYTPTAQWVPPDRGERCRELQAFSRRGAAYKALVLSNWEGRSDAALEDCIELYDGEIASTDFHIRRLVAGFAKARRGRGDAVIVVTSDHGENLGEDGLYFQHGPSLHDAGLLVPLIVVAPGVAPRVERRMARLEDLPPTLLALVGVPRRAWPAFDGADLFADQPSSPDARRDAAFVESGAALVAQAPRYISVGRVKGWSCTWGERFALCEGGGRPLALYEPASDPLLERDVSAAHPEEVAALIAVRQRWPPGSPRQRGVRTLRFKLVESPLPGGGYERRLYDLAADPEESRDVAADHRRELATLSGWLDDWTIRLPTPEPLDLSDEEIETLRSLGYLN